MATPQIELSGQLPPKDTADAEAFSRWYITAIRRSELADYFEPVGGTMVIRPYGFSLWENMQAELDRRFKARAQERLLSAVRARELPQTRGRARRGVRARSRLGDPRGRRGAARAARDSTDQRDHLRALLFEVDPVVARSALADQPVGQHRPLGKTDRLLPAHHRVPVARRPHGASHCRRSPGRDH